MVLRLPDNLREEILDPERFIPRMRIIDNRGKKVAIGDDLPNRPEQVEIIKTLKHHQRTLILKPRQIGATTIVTAFLLHRALFWPDAYDTLLVAHDGGAVNRVNLMLKQYLWTLPQLLAPKRSKANMAEILFKRGDVETAFRQIMAGGRGQGRSYTYRAIHATEMGRWPRGSSATGVENEAADEAVWASTQSCIHEDDDTRVIIESTAEGPSGVFYDQVMTAHGSEEWAFLFFPWAQFHEYEIDPPDRWERRDDEEEIAQLYMLPLLARLDPGHTEAEYLARCDRKLAWRRRKIEDQAYGLTRFRREYPINYLEPFLLSSGMWFDVENINRLAAFIPPGRRNNRADLAIYHKPEKGRRYFIGLDTSGGTGRDWAVAQVLRDDLVQVARWHSKHAGPREAAKQAAQLSLKYGGARVLCEANNTGHAAIERLTKLGVPRWRSREGKDWFTNPQNKAAAYDYARHCIDGNQVEIEDPYTLEELSGIREQKNGNIEADEGKHDDHADSLVLALWCARRYYDARKEVPRDTLVKRQRDRVHRQIHGTAA